MSIQNNKQNINIARLEERVKSLEKKFETFITNDFKHLKDDMQWLMRTVVFGFLISITLLLITRLF